MSAQSRIDFAKWLKVEHPEIFAKSIKAAAAQDSLAGLGEEATKSFWQKFTETAAGLGTTYLALKNQKDAMKINIQRAQDGLAPIDVATSAPAIRTQVDLSPQLTNRLMSTAGEGINKTLLLVGGGILAFFVAKKFL